MRKLVLSVLLAASVAAAEYKAEPAGAPPADLPPAIGALLAKDGIKLTDGGKVVAEMWFRSSLPKGGTAEDMKSLADLPHGVLFGVVRVPERWADRRGQQVKAGLYTMRYSLFPQDGAHQGIAPQRDFLLLVRAADDTDPEKNWDYATVTKTSAKAIGGAHPGVISLWKDDSGDFQPGISTLGEHDQVLRVKVGDTPVAIIIFGRAEG